MAEESGDRGGDRTEEQRRGDNRSEALLDGALTVEAEAVVDGEVRGGRRGRQRQREGLQRGPHHTDKERPPLWPRKVICTGTDQGRRQDRGQRREGDRTERISEEVR